MRVPIKQAESPVELLSYVQKIEKLQITAENWDSFLKKDWQIGKLGKGYDELAAAQMEKAFLMKTRTELFRQAAILRTRNPSLPVVPGVSQDAEVDISVSLREWCIKAQSSMQPIADVAIVKSKFSNEPNAWLMSPDTVQDSVAWGSWITAFLDYFIMRWQAFEKTWECISDDYWEKGEALEDIQKYVPDCLNKAADALQRFRERWVFKPVHAIDGFSRCLREASHAITTHDYNFDLDTIKHYKFTLEDVLARSAESPTVRSAGSSNATPEMPNSASTRTISEQESPEIPPLEINSSDWIKNTVAANLDGVQTETLGDYRGKRIAQYVADDNMSGIDRDGRMWRRAGTSNSHPFYYVPSLKSKKL
jgi:hypothetical protein